MYYNSTNYYVGSSDDIDKRVAEHRNRPQTIVNGGIREVLPPLTPARQDNLEWERAETIRRMMEHGVGRVRGWNYCQTELGEEQLYAIKDNIIGTFNLCHECGYFGHFANACPRDARRAVAGWLQGWYDELSALVNAEDAELTPAERAHYVGRMLERECLGCREDISDRPHHHYMCYDCWSGNPY